MGTPYAQFGNVQFTDGWSLDYQGESSPSVCTIRTIPHLDHLEQHGDLVLGEEGNGQLVLHDCLLLTPSLDTDRKWSLPILDRRWKWAFGELDGVYNVKRPDKTLIREKTPQQLAEILLIAMGERKEHWDIGRLPNYARPECDWTNQNPAEMLSDLCKALGCTYTLDYFNDWVVIWPIGEGRDLPEADTISRQYGYTAIAKPDQVVVKGKRTLFQARFATEAVAMDIDGKIKKFDELTGYHPKDYPYPEDLDDITDAAGDPLTYDDNGEKREISDLAKSWAYRAYRVIGLAERGWSPQELRGSKVEPKSFFDLEFIDTRAEQAIDESDTGQDGQSTGRKVNKPALVMARWYNDETHKTPLTGQLIQYQGRFSFEPGLGLVRFSDPVYLISEGVAQPAVVYVDVAFYAGHDGIYYRPEYRATTGESQGAGAKVIVKDDIEERIIQQYSVTALAGVQKQNDIYSQLKYYADAILKEYAASTQPSLTRTYHGLIPLVPDGRIQQITWSGGGGAGPKTQVSLNTKHNDYVASITDNRRKQVIDQLLRTPAWQRTLSERQLLNAQFG